MHELCRLQPVFGGQEVGIKPHLWRTGFRLPVVTPFDDGRHRHEYRFGASARLQAEQRATVEYQVEFDIAPAAVCLEVALAFAVRCIDAALQNGQVSLEKMVADAFRHGETLLEPELAEIIVKNAADAARFLAMLEVEVFVAPGFETC